MIITEIKEKINKVLETEFEIEPDRLKPDATLFTDLELDSLDIVDLIVALEQAFKIKIRTDDAQEFRDVRTLDDLHNTVHKMYSKLHKQDKQ
jgi:acyl carrier protein